MCFNSGNNNCSYLWLIIIVVLIPVSYTHLVLKSVSIFTRLE